MVLEKTLESLLDCKEIQPVHSKGDQPWEFFGRNDAKAETPVLWPPHAKSLSHWKRLLLLETKVMTNLDSIFKSRDIALPAKVCLVKVTVFPVVMYGCESWTVQESE